MQSLLVQSYSSWTLYVRDDMSTDSTQDLLAEYAQKDARIHILSDDQKRGARDGFMWLLGRVDADYYMFCDHDDVWKKEKIAITLAEMQKQTELFPTLPIIVHTDLEIVDASLKQIAQSHWIYQQYHSEDFNDKYQHLVYNNVVGCTMMINQRAKEISFPMPQAARMHDAWIASSVLWHGGHIASINQQTILYRQHGNNTIGTNEVPAFSKKFLKIRAYTIKIRREYEESVSLIHLNKLRFLAIKLHYMMRKYEKKSEKEGSFLRLFYGGSSYCLRKIAQIQNPS